MFWCFAFYLWISIWTEALESATPILEQPRDNTQQPSLSSSSTLSNISSLLPSSPSLLVNSISLTMGNGGMKDINNYNNNKLKAAARVVDRKSMAEASFWDEFVTAEHVIIHVVFGKNLSPEIIPKILALGMFGVLFCPLNLVHRSARYSLLGSLGRIFVSPLHRVSFQDFYIADVLTSLSRMVLDLAYAFCLLSAITEGHSATMATQECLVTVVGMSFLGGLPLLWRALQCLRKHNDEGGHSHLLNTLKYSLGLSAVLFSRWAVTLMGGAHPLWILLGFVSTTYSLIWDVVMDWALTPQPILVWLQNHFATTTTNSTILSGVLSTIQSSSSNRPLLLFNKSHHQSWYYTQLLVTNLLLRYFWMLNLLSLDQKARFFFFLPQHPQLMASLLAFLELVR
jgi:hypothetical protein